jgi:hypothetical protein
VATVSDERRVLLEAVVTCCAEVISEQLMVHLDEHGCGTGDIRDPRYIGGFGNCPTAMEPFNAQPEGYRILLGSGSA